MKVFFVSAVFWAAWAGPALPREPIPDKLVVLTFDDASKSHFTIARPILKKYGFGATFFITEGFDFPTNKRDYMTWDEIALLGRDGFEIGNHTRDHRGVSERTLRDLPAQVRAINTECQKHGIPVPVSFAYPGNAIDRQALPILKELGFKFARRGGAPEYPYKDGQGFAYEPGLDHPLLIPSAGDARPDWTLDDFKRAVNQARHGKVAVLQFHGVPDTAHDWVTTSQKQFEAYMKCLMENKFHVIALRELAKYVDPSVSPSDPWGVIKDRQHLLELRKHGSNARLARNDSEPAFAGQAETRCASSSKPMRAATRTMSSLWCVSCSMRMNGTPSQFASERTPMRIRFTRDFYCQGKCGRVNFRDHFDKGEIVPEGNSEGCDVKRNKQV